MGLSRMSHDRSMSAQLAFPVAAAVSGFASGISYIVPGGGIIFPGLFFGIALAYAVHHTVEELKPAIGAVLVLLSTCGFWVACITTLFSIRLFGGGNNLASDFIAGILAGSAGASVLAAGLAISSERFQSFRFVAVISATGAVCGAAFAVVVYLHDNAHLPHPIDFIFGYVIWQVGVASVVPLARNNDASVASLNHASRNSN